MRRILKALLLPALAFALLPVATAQQAPPEEREEPVRAEPEQAEEPREAKAEQEEEAGRPVPIYVPPARGTVKIRVGAATRGERRDVPGIIALAPDHVALTTKAQPTLCWFLSAKTDTRIDIALIDDRSVEPLLEFTVRAGIEPGVHTLRLADRGIHLEQGRVYQWFVALVPDPERRSKDVIAGGAIERVAVDPELARALTAAPAQEAWRTFAGHGIWYDAIATLSEQISADPGNRALRSLRARLLDEVDLQRVAAHDRDALGS
jgi:hypothetical protein